MSAYSISLATRPTSMRGRSLVPVVRNPQSAEPWKVTRKEAILAADICSRAMRTTDTSLPARSQPDSALKSPRIVRISRQGQLSATDVSGEKTAFTSSLQTLVGAYTTRNMEHCSCKIFTAELDIKISFFIEGILRFMTCGTLSECNKE